MHRVEWRLVHPVREGHRDRVEELGAELMELDASRTAGLGDDERAWVIESELAALTIPPCEATGAPRVGDSPDWERRALLEFHEDDPLDEPMDFEDYAELRRLDYDCARCPYRTPYTAWPLRPCELAAHPLTDLVPDERAIELALSDLEPPEMLELAGLLDDLRREGRATPTPEVDAADFLTKASLFLRFWATLGFSVTSQATEEPQADAPAGDDDYRRGS